MADNTSAEAVEHDQLPHESELELHDGLEAENSNLTQTNGTNEELKDDDRSHDGQPAMHEKSMADDVKMTDAKAPVPGVKVKRAKEAGRNFKCYGFLENGDECDNIYTRRRTVADHMVKKHDIKRDDFDSARAIEITFIDPERTIWQEMLQPGNNEVPRQGICTNPNKPNTTEQSQNTSMQANSSGAPDNSTLTQDTQDSTTASSEQANMAKKVNAKSSKRSYQTKKAKPKSASKPKTESIQEQFSDHVSEGDDNALDDNVDDTETNGYGYYVDEYGRRVPDSPRSPPQSDDESDTGEDTEEDIPDDGLYCICRKPDDGKTMVCCDACEDWFHIKCVNVTKDQVDYLLISFYCPECTKAGRGISEYKLECSWMPCGKAAIEPPKNNFCDMDHQLCFIEFYVKLADPNYEISDIEAQVYYDKKMDSMPPHVIASIRRKKQQQQTLGGSLTWREISTLINHSLNHEFFMKLGQDPTSTIWDELNREPVDDASMADNDDNVAAALDEPADTTKDKMAAKKLELDTRLVFVNQLKAKHSRAFCGYDSRLDWVGPRFLALVESDEEEKVEAPTGAWKVCKASNCKEHAQWVKNELMMISFHKMDLEAAMKKSGVN